MIIDYASLLGADSAEMQVSGVVDLGDFTIADDILFASPVEVLGYVRNFGGEIEINLDIKSDYRLTCARCLKAFEKSMTVNMVEVLNSEDNRDYLVPDQNKVDITEAVKTNLLINLYDRYICSENCKGLCPVCGADLNETTCNCETEEIDPRFEVLKKFLK